MMEVQRARASRGFTLLEVLIALAILAISATAVIRQSSGSLSQIAELEARTAATVIADNQLNLATLSDSFPATGRSTQTINFNGMDWLVSTEVSDTSDPWLRKIKVSVAIEGLEGEPLISLTGYRGRY